MVFPCRFKGFNESAGFEWDLAPNNNDGPGGTYSKLECPITHTIPIKAIPGKDKRFITMRTSDVYRQGSTGPLYDDMTMTVFCVLEDQHKKCKEFAELGGPYTVQWAFSDNMNVYCKKGVFSVEPGYYDPSSVWFNGLTGQIEGSAFWCQWVFTLEEYNKGIE